MRSIEFHTYLLPSSAGDGTFLPSGRKLTRWQAVAWPGAARIESSREVRECPESPEERQALGFDAPPVVERPKPKPAARAGRRV